MCDDFLGVTLPESSILDEAEYREMYEVAKPLPNMALLHHLHTNGRTLPSDHARTFPDSETRLDQLVDVGLVRRFLDGTCDVSSLGATVVEQGATEGVQTLMENEWDFLETYS
jgi:hypothetical protein